jgi:hypothetical protein
LDDESAHGPVEEVDLGQLERLDELDPPAASSSNDSGAAPVENPVPRLAKTIVAS